MKKIAVIGCGYIGKNIIKNLHKKNYQITAISLFTKEIKDINHFSFQSILLQNINTKELERILENNDVIIISISKNKHIYSDIYIKIAEKIKEAAKKISSKKHLIYTSRAIVYGNQKGMWTDETSSLKPMTELEKILIQAEDIFLSLQNRNWDITILRLSEVYGKDFELTKKIENTSDYFTEESSNFYTNMVHLEDIISVINYVLEHHLTGIYNLADDIHITQKDMMIQMCQKLHIAKKWKTSSRPFQRGNYRISNHKIKSAGYHFLHNERVLS